MENICEKIASIVKAANKPLVQLEDTLENNFKSVSCIINPIFHYRIRVHGATYILCHEKYADNPDYIVEHIAIGKEGKI